MTMRTHLKVLVTRRSQLSKQHLMLRQISSLMPMKSFITGRLKRRIQATMMIYLALLYPHPPLHHLFLTVLTTLAKSHSTATRIFQVTGPAQFQITYPTPLTHLDSSLRRRNLESDGRFYD